MWSLPWIAGNVCVSSGGGGDTTISQGGGSWGVGSPAVFEWATVALLGDVLSCVSVRRCFARRGGGDNGGDGSIGGGGDDIGVVCGGSTTLSRGSATLGRGFVTLSCCGNPGGGVSAYLFSVCCQKMVASWSRADRLLPEIRAIAVVGDGF